MNEVSKFDLFGEVIHIKDEYARSMLNRTSGNVTHLNQIGRFWCNNVRENSSTPYLFQGGCITDDGHAVVAARCATDGKVDLYRVNLNSGEKEKFSYDQPMGHANSVAYDTRGFLIVSDTVVANKFHKIAYPDMTYMGSYDNTEECTWFWIDENNNYYGGQSYFVCTFDHDFALLKKTPVNKPISATGQTGMVVDGIYYHLNYNPNAILMYDANTGEFIKCQYLDNLISNMFNIGEPEWIDYRNGVFYCGCNENGNDTSRNPLIHRICKFDPGKNTVSGENSSYMGDDAMVAYVSGDFIFNPDGSNEKPFTTIREAALLVHTIANTGIEMIATKPYTETYDIILQGSCYYAINTVNAHPLITMNGNIKLGRGVRLRMKTVKFATHASFETSSVCMIHLDTGEDHMFPNGVDMTLEPGTILTASTKPLRDIFKSGNTLYFDGCTVNCTNDDWPLNYYIVDNCPTFTSASFTHNFPVLAGAISNSNNSFTCNWFPEKFYIKWGNETFTIIRNVSSSPAGVECTGSNDYNGNLEIKQLSMMISSTQITDFKAKLFTGFSTGTEDSTEALIVY